MSTALQWPLNVPVLTDGVVTLRAHRPEDIDLMLEMANDPVTGIWTTVPQPHTREMSEQFAFQTIPQAWNDGEAAMWAIESNDDDGHPRYVGNLDIRGRVNPDVGFALHPRARGRGLMTRALRLGLQWTFENTDAEIVRWQAQTGNEASLRVAHSCGFSLDAIVPGLLPSKGTLYDGWVGSIRSGDSMTPRTRWAEAVPLEGERVRLRPFRDNDASRIAEACSDPESRHWLSGLPDPYTEASARTYLADTVWKAAQGDKANWAIADLETDELIGNIAVMYMNGIAPDHGEIGYWTHPSARGKGVMTEALGLVIDHAFSPDGLDRRRLSLLAAAGNSASNAVAQANRFRHIGVQQQAERLGNGELDSLQVYELLRSELG